MTNNQDRPGIGERYSAATESSDLSLGERRGDVDLLIAAGFVADGLGPALYRLQGEFTAVRPTLDATRRWADQQYAMAREVRKIESSRNAIAAAQLEDAARASIRTEFALALSGMRSLREVKERWASHAIAHATRAKFMRPDETVVAIAGRVLDVWLDPRCMHCNGRGFTGATHRGEKEVFCKPCRGGGDRRASIGNDDTERSFAGKLMMELDALVTASGKEIRRGLALVERAKVLIAEAQAS